MCSLEVKQANMVSGYICDEGGQFQATSFILAFQI